MSSQTMLGPIPGRAGQPPAPVEVSRPVRGFTAQAIHDTFRRWGARIGAVWIGLLVLAAVFAPFIAGSHPILLKMNGRWSSPLLRHLTAADVILLAAFFTVLVLAFMGRLPFRNKMFGLLGVLGVTIPLALWLVRPPQAVVYSQYREAASAGQVEYAIYAPIPYSPTDRLRDQPETRLTAPTRRHLMGTELNGADVFSRMIHASRIALSIGFIATGIAIIIGCIIGGLMGYLVGKTDMLGMRLIEIFESIPTLFLLIAFVAFFGRNLYVMMVIIGVTSWSGYARFIRADFLKLRKEDFVQAAIAAGLPLRSILFRHMLPNGITAALISASFGIASAILAESTLSFLGLGLIDKPSWGQLLSQAVGQGGSFQWWMALYPGLAIFLTVYAYNMIGESLRDALDPRVNQVR